MCVMTPFIPPTIPAKGYKVGYKTIPKLPSYPEVIEGLLKECDKANVLIVTKKDRTDCEEKIRRAVWKW